MYLQSNKAEYNNSPPKNNKIAAKQKQSWGKWKEINFRARGEEAFLLSL